VVKLRLSLLLAFSGISNRETRLRYKVILAPAEQLFRHNSEIPNNHYVVAGHIRIMLSGEGLLGISTVLGDDVFDL
jgi:hypothetical protein